jgi:hypothetical protein
LHTVKSIKLSKKLHKKHTFLRLSLLQGFPVEDKKGRIPSRGVVKAKDLARAHEKVPRGHFKGKKQILYESAII